MRASLLPRKYKKKNLLLLGASGGVSNAFLHYLTHHRDVLNQLVLLDRSTRVLQDPYLDHKGLQYVFIHKDLKFPQDEKEYYDILRSHKIDIVLDLTDMDSIPVLEITDKARVNYINTAMNDEVRIVSDLVLDVYPRKEKLHGAPHILCTGMNPGVVNMWARYGIEKFGVPDRLTHFEYDTSTISLGWKAMMTWSLREFIVESIRDPGGQMEGRDKVRHLYPNSLSHRVDMTHLLAPVMHLDVYPQGFHVLHEENLSMAQRYDVPSQFIYAFNMQTMEELVSLYDRNHNVFIKDLTIGDNLIHPMSGADNIGVVLEYDKRKVYYLNSAPNSAVIGTSGTYAQVIVGVFAALFVLLFDDLPKGAHFVEDLYGTHYKNYVFDNMRVEEFVFERENGVFRRTHYNPRVRLKRKHYWDHVYI